MTARAELVLQRVEDHDDARLAGRRRSVRTRRRAWRAATASPTPSGMRAKAP